MGNVLHLFFNLIKTKYMNNNDMMMMKRKLKKFPELEPRKDTLMRFENDIEYHSIQNRIENGYTSDYSSYRNLTSSSSSARKNKAKNSPQQLISPNITTSLEETLENSIATTNCHGCGEAQHILHRLNDGYISDWRHDKIQTLPIKQNNHPSSKAARITRVAPITKNLECCSQIQFDLDYEPIVKRIIRGDYQLKQLKIPELFSFIKTLVYLGRKSVCIEPFLRELIWKDGAFESNHSQLFDEKGNVLDTLPSPTKEELNLLFSHKPATRSQMSKRNPLPFLSDIATSGNVRLMKYALSKRSNLLLSNDLCLDAAKSGDLRMFKLLVEENGCPYNTFATCQAVCKGGSLELLLYLRQLGYMAACYQSAASSGSIELMNYLNMKSLQFNLSSMIEFISVAIEINRIEVLGYFLEIYSQQTNKQFHFLSDHYEIAGCKGNKSMIDLMISKNNGEIPPPELFIGLIIGGHVQLYKWFSQVYQPNTLDNSYLGDDLCTLAISQKSPNHMKMFKLLRKQGCTVDNAITFLQTAIDCDSLKLLKYIYPSFGRSARIIIKQNAYLAIQSTGFEIFDWLKDQNLLPPLDHRLLRNALISNSFAKVKRVICSLTVDLESCSERDSQYYWSLAYLTNYDQDKKMVFEYLLEQKLPIKHLFQMAIKSWSSDYLDWLYEKKCPLDSQTFTNAVIKSGAIHSGVICSSHKFQWLCDRKCPWDAKTLYAVIEMFEDDLKIVQWFVEQGCPIDESCATLAIKLNKFEILQYLRNMGCPLTTNMLIIALNHQVNFEYIKWFIESGCPMNVEVGWSAFLRSSVEIIHYLKTNGCPFEMNRICSSQVNNRFKPRNCVRSNYFQQDIQFYINENDLKKQAYDSDSDSDSDIDSSDDDSSDSGSDSDDDSSDDDSDHRFI
jgi:hypothetical protein